MSLFGNAVWSVVALVALTGGFVVGRRTSQNALTREVVATIGEHKLHRYDLNRVSKLFEPRVIEMLCFQTVIEDEAARRGLKTDIKDNGTFSSYDARIEDLLSKIILQDISKASKEKVFNQFQETLQRYDLKMAFFLNESAMQSFQSELASGGDFAALNLKHGIPAGVKDAVRVTATEIHTILGDTALAQIEQTDERGVTEPLRVGGAFLIVQVTKRYDSYEELLPEIDRLIVESKKLLVMSSLISHAIIDSPLHPVTGYRIPRPEESMPPAAKLVEPVQNPAAPAPTNPVKFDPSKGTEPTTLPVPKNTGLPPSSLPNPKGSHRR